MRVPIPKKKLLKRRPALRPKISVSLPERGWQAEFAIKYPVASHDRRDKESNSEDIGPVNVATILVSIHGQSVFESDFLELTKGREKDADECCAHHRNEFLRRRFLSKDNLVGAIWLSICV